MQARRYRSCLKLLRNFPPSQTLAVALMATRPAWAGLRLLSAPYAVADLPKEMQ